MSQLHRMNSSAQNVPAAFNEEFPDVLFGRAKNFGQLPVSYAVVVERFCENKIEGWWLVLSPVFPCAQQLKIIKPIVQNIAVDVMNMFKSLKLAPKMLSHDPSVFENPFTIDVDQFVSVRAFHFTKLVQAAGALK